MLSKKKLIKRIEELEERLAQLENMHADVHPFVSSWGRLLGFDYEYNGMEGAYYNGKGRRQLTREELKNLKEHPQTKERAIYTKTIPNVTLSELAQYVLDGKPIVRKTTEKVTYVTEHGPSTKTKTVETKLGNISMTERTD